MRCLLLLDEHTAALDPKTAAFALALTHQIVQQRQLAVMMVTHSLRQALDLGCRTLTFREGRVVLDVRGEEKEGLDVPGLLKLFERTRGAPIQDVP